MKKLLKVSVVFLLCIVLCANNAFACSMFPVGRIAPVGSKIEIVEETEDSVTIRKTDETPFKILMFTDTHFATPTTRDPLKMHKLTAQKMIDNIRREKPDLVLVGGDNVTSTLNFLRSHRFAQLFEKLGVYWGGVIGNHEGDKTLSIRRDTMVKIFSSYDHCLMRQGSADVDGNCNYSIRILNADGSLKHAFICLDSFDEMSDEMKKEHGYDPSEGVYDVIKQTQIDWYTSQINEIRQKYGKCPSSVLLHIPLTQYADAYDLVEQGEMRLLWGEKREKICCGGFDSGLFDAILAGESTKTVFCGHDHTNNFGVEYQGVVLTYIQSSGYGTGGLLKKDIPESEWWQGYTRLTLADDGTFTHEQFRNSALS